MQCAVSTIQSSKRTHSVQSAAHCTPLLTAAYLYSVATVSRGTSAIADVLARKAVLYSICSAIS